MSLVAENLELMTRHQEGDAQAFGELVAAYRRPVYNYLLRCGVEAASREDLLQEIFLRIHRAAPRYVPNRPLRVWLFTIAANTMRSHFRHVAVQRRVFVPGAAEAWSGEPNGQQVAEAQEAVRAISEAAAGLPLLQREVLVLSTLCELSHKEVADVLGIPVNSVKTNLRRARLALAKEMARRSARSRFEVER